MNIKVIVINDSDGHTNVFSANKKNLLKLCEYLKKIGEDIEGFSENSTEDELYEILEESQMVDQRGGMVNIVELIDDIKYCHNPFQ